MSLRYKRVISCWRCMASSELGTDGNGHLVERVSKVCSCAPVQLETVTEDYDAKRQAKECERCGASCRGRHCLQCARVLARTDRELPKCRGCGAGLNHYAGVWCKLCRRVEEARLRAVKKARLEAEAA